MSKIELENLRQEVDQLLIENSINIAQINALRDFIGFVMNEALDPEQANQLRLRYLDSLQKHSDDSLKAAENLTSSRLVRSHRLSLSEWISHHRDNLQGG